MKSTTLLFIILLSSASLFAQNKNSERIMRKFMAQFNEKKFEDIYNSLSPGYQQKVSNKAMQTYLNQIYGMAGKFKSAKFKTFTDFTYTYFLVAKSEDVNADFQFIIDKDNKIDYLNFKAIGGNGNPPPGVKFK